MPGRAINTPFMQALKAGKNVSARKCEFVCLKKCDHHYCISERLNMAREGNVEEGLVFSGENTYKMKDILSVAEIFEQFKRQAESVFKEGRGFSPIL